MHPSWTPAISAWSSTRSRCTSRIRLNGGDRLLLRLIEARGGGVQFARDLYAGEPIFRIQAPRRAERLAPGRPPEQAGGRPYAEHDGHPGEALRPRGEGARTDRAEGSLDGGGAGTGRRGHRRPAMERSRGVPGRRVGARSARVAGGRGREPGPGTPPRLVGQGQRGPGRGPARPRRQGFRQSPRYPRPEGRGGRRRRRDREHHDRGSARPGPGPTGPSPAWSSG